MIDRTALLADAKALTARLVDDLRERTERDDDSRMRVRGTYHRARSARRTDKSYEEWREDLLAQVASGWVLASVFVRFCEDNRLHETPLLSGPGAALDLARDHRAEFFAANPTAGDREWLTEVYRRYQRIPAVTQIFGERNPLWQLAPSADGARDLLETWWARDAEGREIRHDFTDPELGTRFLGDLYQDLSEHAREQYALLQTPDFVESFILDRTLDPAIAEFGLAEVKMVDPTCGSGHFLLGAFHRLFARWREREPATGARELVQRALDAVHGVDVNPFAVEIARFRLLVAALRAAGERRLDDLPAFRLNLAVGDSLLHGTRPEALFSAAAEYGDTLRHHYPTEDAEQAEGILSADAYHAVVGNPPYINVADAALNEAYRSLYVSCHRQYSLVVPFLERFFQLAKPGATNGPAGYVGTITANSFMKREFGRKLIEGFLSRVDLTHIIDTQNTEIPGHATPTVILFGRNQLPNASTIRAVLGIRGEAGRPTEPAEGRVWASIVGLLNSPGTENTYVTVRDVERRQFDRHPWSLQGGYSGPMFDLVEEQPTRLSEIVHLIGYTGQTNADPVFIGPRGAHVRHRVEHDVIRDVVEGDTIRDYLLRPGHEALFPYDLAQRDLIPITSRAGLERRVWPCRTIMGNRQTFSKQSYFEEGKPWWDWHQVSLGRVPGYALTFAAIATHNHFVLDRGGKVFKQSAPMVKLPSEAALTEYRDLLGLLNSSVACFWMKQVFHCKGKMSSGTGGVVDEEWEPFYDLDGTKLRQFPVPAGRPTYLGKALDEESQGLARTLPGSVAERQPPARDVLSVAAGEARMFRARLVALQEELDWKCYRLYGLIDEDLTFDLERLPRIDKGQRAFEIALARRMAAGEMRSTWFERHGSTPITEIPVDWPENYRALVERRLDLIKSDRGIGLLERPEYKRRWNWEDLGDLEREAQRTWLLDRIEGLAARDSGGHVVTTCARLADALARDADAVAVAEDLSGASVDLVALVTELVGSAAVPYLAAWRLTESGMRKHQAWERTWELQRVEDALEARTRLPEDRPEHLSTVELEIARKEAGVDKIPVPPRYAKGDFRSATVWNLRGKLDVPKERFIAYPGTKAGADTTPVVGWAGWDDLPQARALASHYSARKQAGAEEAELVPLLAGVAELVPWLLQWHDEPDPTFGERMGQFFDGFVATEAASLGVTRDDLAARRPPAPTRGRRRKART